MNAVSTVDDPGIAAELAAEAVRTLNHLTLVSPSAGTPGWEEDLGVAQGALAHLAPRDATLAGELMAVGLYRDGREEV